MALAAMYYQNLINKIILEMDLARASAILLKKDGRALPLIRLRNNSLNRRNDDSYLCFNSSLSMSCNFVFYILLMLKKIVALIQVRQSYF